MVGTKPHSGNCWQVARLSKNFKHSLACSVWDGQGGDGSKVFVTSCILPLFNCSYEACMRGLPLAMAMPLHLCHVFTKATRASVMAGVMRSKPVRSGGHDFS